MKTTLIPLRDGVCVVDGYGIKISVERGHLQVADGTGRSRRKRRFTRSARKLKRLVLIGHTGYVTLDALRWINDTGAAFIHIDEGRLLTTSTPAGLADARLRRAQALLAGTPAGLAISRRLITDKLRGQAAILTAITGEPPPTAFSDAFNAAQHETDTDRLRLAEANAAKAYWNPISRLELDFAANKPVPDHWRTVGSRSSNLNTSPRNATTPAHAIWNYLYAVLEAETTLAAYTLGLDSTVGINHANRKHRDSLTMDLMEPLRPLIDTQVLQLFHDRRFSPDDFHETRQGIARVNPPLTHHLVELSAAWRTEVYNRVRHTAALIAKTGAGDIRIPGAGLAANQPSATPTLKLRRSTRQQTCRTCGMPVTHNERVLCDDCNGQHKAAEKLRIPHVGTTALADWKAGATIEEREDVRRKQSDRNTQRHAEHRRWREENPDAPTDPAWYDDFVRPHLQHLTRAQIVRETGFTPSYASQVRNGNRTPHPMHWASIRRLLAHG